MDLGARHQGERDEFARLRQALLRRAYNFEDPASYRAGVEVAVAAARTASDGPQDPAVNESRVARVRACAVGFAIAAPPGIDAVTEVAEMAEHEAVLLLAAQRRLEERSPLDGRVRLAAQELLRAALLRTSDPGPSHDHQVAFHADRAPLTDALVDLLTPAVAADGDAEALVIATPEHHRAFETGLASRVAADGRRRRRYLALDAEATMATFLVDGRPDRGRFLDTVAPQIERVAARTGQVHIYGEIVALLWERGQQEAAIALEELWNELATQLSFRLLCGYPTRIFDAPVDIEPLRAVCHHHSEVVPALAA